MSIFDCCFGGKREDANDDSDAGGGSGGSNGRKAVNLPEASNGEETDDETEVVGDEETVNDEEGDDEPGGPVYRSRRSSIIGSRARNEGEGSDAGDLSQSLQDNLRNARDNMEGGNSERSLRRLRGPPTNAPSGIVTGNDGAQDHDGSTARPPGFSPSFSPPSHVAPTPEQEENEEAQDEVPDLEDIRQTFPPLTRVWSQVEVDPAKAGKGKGKEGER